MPPPFSPKSVTSHFMVIVVLEGLSYLTGSSLRPDVRCRGPARSQEGPVPVRAALINVPTRLKLTVGGVKIYTLAKKGTPYQIAVMLGGSHDVAQSIL